MAPEVSQLAVVKLEQAGVCLCCGLATSNGCPSCFTEHFCSAACLSALFGEHGKECGQPGRRALALPPEQFMNSPVNVRLRTGERFGLLAKRGDDPHSFGADPAYGLVTVDMPVKDCQRLADLVLHSRSADGHLELQGKVFKGYHRYPYIDDDVVDGEVQQRVTTQLVKSGAEFNHINFWLKHCEAFRRVVQRMADLLGVSVARLKQAHFIRQKSRQCQFTWHQDHNDLGLSQSMVTVVICLAGGSTGVQVWGFRPFTYTGVGCGVAFAGAATHRSVYQVVGSDRQHAEVVKMGMFWD